MVGSGAGGGGSSPALTVAPSTACLSTGPGQPGPAWPGGRGRGHQRYRQGIRPQEGTLSFTFPGGAGPGQANHQPSRTGGQQRPRDASLLELSASSQGIESRAGRGSRLREGLIVRPRFWATGPCAARASIRGPPWAQPYGSLRLKVAQRRG